jgi:spore coat protein U-like protein
VRFGIGGPIANSYAVKKTLEMVDNRLGATVLNMTVTRGRGTMSMKSAAFAFAFSFLVFEMAPQPSVAATASASFGVSVMVQDSCLASASSPKSGTDTIPLENTLYNVSVKCINPAPYTVSLSTGQVPGSLVAAQETAPGSALFRYLPASNTGQIMNGRQTVATDADAGISSASLQTLSLRNQIPAGNNFAAGADVDTITVTVTY